MLDMIHGANPERLYRAFGLPVPEKIIDFSTNTNVITWPAVNVNLQELASRYPDPDCTELRELVAEREGVSSSRVLFTNGTNEAVFLLSQVLRGSTGVLEPSYSEYRRAFPNLRGTFSLEEAGKFANFIIINPNNPTGKFLALSELIAANKETLFIIDEAYRDFLLFKAPERLCAFRNVVILRSLTKIYPLSGVRIGYVIAAEEVIVALRERQPSWSVNAVAQALALVFLRDEDFLGRTRAFYRENVPALAEGLRGAGCEVMESDVHFFLVGVKDDEEAVRSLLKKGLVVRHTRNFTGLEGKFFRAAARCREENERLIDAVRELL